MGSFHLSTNFYEITADRQHFLTVKTKTGMVTLPSPVFEMDEEEVSFAWKKNGGTEKLMNTGVLNEIIYEQIGNENTMLHLWIKTYEDSPILRFKYELTSQDAVHLTKKNGCDNIFYTGFAIEDCNSLEEIQFAQYIPHMHSFVPVFRNIQQAEYLQYSKMPGPVLLACYKETTCIMAYEHGAGYPDSYLEFVFHHKNFEIRARKGNYYNGMPCSGQNPFESAWFEFGLLDGTRDEMLVHYRNFMLSCICDNNESRKPYIFYNTWNYQERSHNFLHRGYIEDLHFDRICSEIEAAHRMGIEVFVIDTGWFDKTGDWIVNKEKFPDRLLKVKEKLDSYGMKLGLWFNPTVTARTSEIVTNHPEYKMSLNGESKAFSIWETEESYGMCLCSDYWEFFVKKCSALYHELGVRYFKWDGIGQYGCDSPLHDHGGENNTPQERSECYSYMMGLRMIRIVESLLKECPESIVDFDITESGRFVGLGFLSVGKYFLINNGPYAKDFDMPRQFIYQQKEPVEISPYVNIFFYPGAARQRFCREGLKYDNFIPSILFLTHYFPDGPINSQENSLASLVLGGNGIWGDLSALSDEDIQFFAENFKHYKIVREDVTKSYPIVTGEIGASPEIHEKINPSTGKGLICIFAHFAGEYTYVTQNMATPPHTVIGAKRHEFIDNGCLSITVELEADSAATVFIY